MCKTVATIMGVMMSVIAFAAPTVTDVVAKQRYPWNGLVDITCKVSGIEGKRKFVVSAVMPDSGKVVGLKNFWVVRNGEKSTSFEVSVNGDYRLLWDAKADLGEVRYNNMVVRIALDDIHDKVQLWEGGPYWATANIGAEKPEDGGYYFWWGDTVGYKRENNSWVASDGSNSSFSFTESNTPTYSKGFSTLQREGWITSEGVLAPEHDAAKKHCGGDWRMPTRQEFDNLFNKCEWVWTSTNGVNGYVVRGKGDYSSKSIFLPCVGYGNGTSLFYAGSNGFYWSSVPDSDYDYVSAYHLYFYSGYRQAASFYYRRSGQSVRPVSDVSLGSEGNAIISGESSPISLDTASLFITASIAFNASWIGNNSDATVVITDNGAEIYRGSGVGDFAWVPQSQGKHTLTYITYVNDEAQGDILSATLYAGFKYDMVEGGAVLTEVAEISEKLIIPNEIDGLPVVGIRDGLFNGFDNIVDVSMPYTVAENILDIFPDSCESITNVVLTGNVMQIPVEAFAGCTSLKLITLQESGATLHLGNDKGWRFDENGVLRSGKITDNESSSMSMTVQGEGRITYRWKASTDHYDEYVFDYAYLSIGNSEKGSLNDYMLSDTAIGGNTDWKEESYDIIQGEADELITWTFKKDESDEGDIGEDCVWVDSIAFTPFVKIAFDIADGEGATPNTIKDLSGGVLTLPTAEGFKKPKYTFVGWSDGSTTYMPGEKFVLGTSDVVLRAVYESNTILTPVIESDDVVDGGEITTASATISITADDGVSIFYTLDGSLPTAESLRYEDEFEADGLGDVTIKAIALRENYFDSPVATFNFKRRPYSVAECLNVEASDVKTDSENGWSRVMDGEAHDGDAALRSGVIGDNESTSVEIVVNGSGTISFWWKTSSENIKNGLVKDYVSFTIDGAEQAWLAGETDWEKVSCNVTGVGPHTLRWTYLKNNNGKTGGQDCAWLDLVTWTQMPQEPIPELSATATTAEVSAALEGSADAKLIANITDAATYAAYRTWALGLEGITPDAVKASPFAWLSFALDTDALIAAAPKEGAIVIDTFEIAATEGAFEFAVKIDGIAVGDNALEVNLKKVFDIEGAEKLASGGAGFSSDNVDVNTAAPENGNVKFTVKPKMENGEKPDSFFFRVKMK
jgi:hypothetical protein